MFHTTLAVNRELIMEEAKMTRCQKTQDPRLKNQKNVKKHKTQDSRIKKIYNCWRIGKKHQEN